MKGKNNVFVDDGGGGGDGVENIYVLSWSANMLLVRIHVTSIDADFE